MTQMRKSAREVIPYCARGTVELHISRLIGTASHPYMQKIRIIGFFLGKWAALAVQNSASCKPDA